MRARKQRKPGRKPPAGSAPRRSRRSPAKRPQKSPAQSGRASALRWNPDPEDVQRSVVKLVLSLVEFIRKLMERQALRRLEEKTLSPDEIERVGVALMKLEQTVHQIAKQFNLDPADLNLDLGPVGRLH